MPLPTWAQRTWPGVQPLSPPCKLAGTAVDHLHRFEDGEGPVIDCAATQAAGGCPWQRDRPHGGLPEYHYKDARYHYNFDCWYPGRGDAAPSILERLDAAGHQLPAKLQGGFFGPPWPSGGLQDNDTHRYLSPGYCHELAGWMANHGEAYLDLVNGDLAASPGRSAACGSPEQAITQATQRYRYATWWLRFVADRAEGALAHWGYMPKTPEDPAERSVRRHHETPRPDPRWRAPSMFDTEVCCPPRIDRRRADPDPSP